MIYSVDNIKQEYDLTEDKGHEGLVGYVRKWFTPVYSDDFDLLGFKRKEFRDE